MKSPSQEMLILFKEKKIEEAFNLLKQHGCNETKILNALSFETKDYPKFIEYIQTKITEIPQEEIENSFLLALANKTSWNKRELFLNLLASNSSAEFFEYKNPIHHAVFHSLIDSYDILEKYYEQKVGRKYNWNCINKDGFTPLFLAIYSLNSDNVSTIILNGADTEFKLSHPKFDGLNAIKSILKFKPNQGPLFNEIYFPAKEKATILKEIEQENPQKDKKNKKRKI